MSRLVYKEEWKGTSPPLRGNEKGLRQAYFTLPRQNRRSLPQLASLRVGAFQMQAATLQQPVDLEVDAGVNEMVKEAVRMLQ